MKNNNFYVYEHWRLDRNECFYVGKGKGGRAHERRHRNFHWKAIVAKIEKAGFGYEVRFVATKLSEEEAFALERERIAFWKADGSDLSNMTDGGEGTSGWSPPKEFRDAVSKVHKGKKISDWQKAQISQSLKGNPRNEEVKRKISEKLKGRSLSEETKKKLSEINKGKKASEETKNKMSETRKGRPSLNKGKKFPRKKEIQNVQ